MHDILHQPQWEWGSVSVSTAEEQKIVGVMCYWIGIIPELGEFLLPLARATRFSTKDLHSSKNHTRLDTSPHDEIIGWERFMGFSTSSKGTY